MNPTSWPTLQVHATLDGNFARGENQIGADGISSPVDMENVDFERVASAFEGAVESHSDLQGHGGWCVPACHAASTGLASRFAKRLGIYVLAPTEAPAISSGVRPGLICHDQKVAEMGAHWVVFDPNGRAVERIRPNIEQNRLAVSALLDSIKIKQLAGDDAVRTFWQHFVETEGKHLDPVFFITEPHIVFNTLPSDQGLWL